MIYLDSSAIVKLVAAEPESAALRRELAAHPERVSSALARVEVLRALRRMNAGAEVLERAEQVLDRIALARPEKPVLRAAADLRDRGLRTLDALHLATALSLPGLDALVTYDRRLAAAATAAGLAVLAPAEIPVAGG